MADTTEAASLNAGLLTKTITKDPRPLPLPASPEVRLLEYHTDHMILVPWNNQIGWSAPSLQPYGPLPISPAASGLHYAVQCFEGLKLHRGSDGLLRLFRSIDNCERMRQSAARVALPDFDASELQKLIVALCAHEAPKWLLRSNGEGALYIRPALVGTDPGLATSRSRSALLYIFLTVFPSPPKSSTPAPEQGFKLPTVLPQRRSMRLLASEKEQIRAWPGGFGNTKVGANYGPTFALQDEAKAKGWDQILWLYGEERFVTEAGACNFFVVLRDCVGGACQLVTAPLEDGVILPGVTRASALQLVREGLDSDIGSVEVVERQFTMAELVKAHDEGRIVEAFVTGTAMFVVPVGVVHFEGRDLNINCEGALLSERIKQRLTGIMTGKEQHEWAVLVDEE